MGCGSVSVLSHRSVPDGMPELPSQDILCTSHSCATEALTECLVDLDKARIFLPENRAPRQMANTKNMIGASLKVELEILEMTVTATAVCSVSTFYSDRFISKLKHNIHIIFQFRMLRDNIPHFEQKYNMSLLFLVPPLDREHSVTDKVPTHGQQYIPLEIKYFCHRHEQLLKIFPKAGFQENHSCPHIFHGLHGGVITPIRPSCIGTRIKLHPATTMPSPPALIIPEGIPTRLIITHALLLKKKGL